MTRGGKDPQVWLSSTSGHSNSTATWALSCIGRSVLCSPSSCPAAASSLSLGPRHAGAGIPVHRRAEQEGSQPAGTSSSSSQPEGLNSLALSFPLAMPGCHRLEPSPVALHTLELPKCLSWGFAEFLRGFSCWFSEQWKDSNQTQSCQTWVQSSPASGP